MKRIPTCHPEKRYASNGLCSTCYSSKRTSERRKQGLPYSSVPAKCHPEKAHVGKGLCDACYRFQRRNGPTGPRVALEVLCGHPERPHAGKNKCLECFRKFRSSFYIYKGARQKSARIKALYGVTESEFNQMFEVSFGLCQICKTEPGLSIDHDHSTNKIRGLLCGNCNRAIGLFYDNLSILKNACAYLEKTETIPWKSALPSINFADFWFLLGFLISGDYIQFTIELQKIKKKDPASKINKLSSKKP